MLAPNAERAHIPRHGDHGCCRPIQRPLLLHLRRGDLRGRAGVPDLAAPDPGYGRHRSGGAELHAGRERRAERHRRAAAGPRLAGHPRRSAHQAPVDDDRDLRLLGALPGRLHRLPLPPRRLPLRGPRAWALPRHAGEPRAPEHPGGSAGADRLLPGVEEALRRPQEGHPLARAHLALRLSDRRLGLRLPERHRPRRLTRASGAAPSRPRSASTPPARAARPSPL